MKLKSQLVISIIIFAIILITVSASIIFTDQQLTQISTEEKITNNLNTGASGLAYISNDYFLYQQNDQLILWQTQFSSLKEDLSKLNSDIPEQQRLINSVKDDLQRLGTVFNSSVLLVENIPNDGRVHPELNTASSRLAVQNQALAFDASILSNSFEDQASQTKQTNSILVFTLLAAFGVYFATIYLIVFRRTFASITKLQEGTKIIGLGNLDYTIASKSNDEIGELSQAFNQMTSNLKAVTASKSDLEKTQDSLRESEQRWSTTLASIGDAVIATDLSGKVMFMNGEAEELTGWKLNEVSQRPVKEVFNIVNEQTRLEVENPIDQVLREGIVVGLANHTVLIRKDGLEVPIDDSGAPIRDKDYKTTGVVLIFRDITERKKAEETQRENEERLQQALDAGEFGLWGLNVITGKAWRTLRHDQIFGYNEFLPEWTYQMFLSHVLPEDRAMVDEKFGGALKRGTEWNFECRIKRANGEEHWIWAQGIPKFNEKHTVVQLVGVVKDITERKKAEESVARQAELIDLSPDAIIVRKLDGTITFWSKGAEKLYGWTKNEAVGQNINTLLKTELPQSLEAIQNRIKLEEKWSGEVVHICKDESKLVVQSYWLGKFGSDGKISEMLESNVDITQRIQMQVKLEESAVRLEEYANQMEELANQRAAQLKDSERLAAIGATAGMVGHDIRNPLQAITGDIYLAKTELDTIPEGEEKKNIQDSLTEIEKNVDYINKIVADLQDFARPLKPNVEETDLKRIIDDLLSKNGLPENVKVSVKVEAGKVVADSTFINRIMYNLVTNAVQAMPKGGKLTIRTYKDANDTVISVKDTGVGIPEAVKDKLFTPMFTTKSKGQGFGLAVIKRMAEALGGTVSFESQEGKGTTFIIRLPPQGTER